MTETTPEDAAAQRAAEQARLRKERREAKIKSGGTSRLNKITGLGGREPEPASTPTPVSSDDSPKPTAAASAAEHADPAEVDISQHFSQPSRTAPAATPSGTPPIDPNAMSEAQLRQMMLGFDQSSAGGGPPPQMPGQQPGGENPFAAAAAGLGVSEDDPMMKMLSQMMAGAGDPGAGGAPGQMPPFFPPGFPGAPGAQQGPARKTSTSAYLWRLVHAIFALTLGFYITTTTHFSGSKSQRERTALALSSAAHAGEGTYDPDFDSPPTVTGLDPEAKAMEEGKEVFFWMFATAEALLITTRFLLQQQRGGADPEEAGMLWTVVGFLPSPWKGRAETALRYGQVFSSVRRDILVCVFVLGVAAWVRG